MKAELEALHQERLDVVEQLRSSGLSHLEVAELLGVTKARAQQLEKEARARHAGSG